MPITLFICDQYTSIKIVLHVIMHGNMKCFYLTDSTGRNRICYDLFLTTIETYFMITSMFMFWII